MEMNKKTDSADNKSIGIRRGYKRIWSVDEETELEGKKLRAETQIDICPVDSSLHVDQETVSYSKLDQGVIPVEIPITVNKRVKRRSVHLSKANFSHSVDHSRGTVKHYKNRKPIISDLEAEGDKKGIEHSSTATQLEQNENERTKNSDVYVYRILRFDETHERGLHPKNMRSKVSIEQHVENGSKGVMSKYISCSKSLDGVISLGRLTNESSRIREVVKINVTKLSNNVEVIDLTKEEIRRKYIDPDSRAWDYAEKFEEVILSAKTCVPSECVEKFGKIQHRKFRRTENIVRTSATADKTLLRW